MEKKRVTAGGIVAIVLSILRLVIPRKQNRLYSSNSPSNSGFTMPIIMVIIIVIALLYIIYIKRIKGTFDIQSLIKRNKHKSALRSIDKHRSKGEKYDDNMLMYYEALVYLNRDDRKFTYRHFSQLDIDASVLPYEARCNLYLANIEFLVLERKDSRSELTIEDLRRIDNLLKQFEAILPNMASNAKERMVFELGKVDFFIDLFSKTKMDQIHELARQSLLHALIVLQLLKSLDSETNYSSFQNECDQRNDRLTEPLHDTHETYFTYPIRYIERTGYFALAYRIILMAAVAGIVMFFMSL